jgi:hypothetical protein
LLDDPGSVGISQGNQVAAAATETAFTNMRIPAIRDNIKALIGFSLWLIDFYTIPNFPGYSTQLKTYKSPIGDTVKKELSIAF